MASRGVDPVEKVANWLTAYRAIAAELTSDDMRERMNAMLTLPLPEDPDNIVTYTARLNTSMAFARLIAANDRAAATVAAMLVATGIKPTAIDYGDDRS